MLDERKEQRCFAKGCLWISMTYYKFSKSWSQFPWLFQAWKKMLTFPGFPWRIHPEVSNTLCFPLIIRANQWDGSFKILSRYFSKMLSMPRLWGYPDPCLDSCHSSTQTEIRSNKIVKEWNKAQMAKNMPTYVLVGQDSALNKAKRGFGLLVWATKPSETGSSALKRPPIKH